MYIYSDEKIILASFRFLSLFIYSAFHSQELAGEEIEVSRR